MEKQISIIIPTYNMEKYIGKCLDSLLIPEFDQVEVLVVNDGSKDRSSEIAHEYANRYPNSIRVIDKENGNYGSCINAALPQCTGRYVKILDADDTFDTKAFSELVSLLCTCDEDVIVTNHVIITVEGNILSTSSFPQNTKIGVTIKINEAVKTVASGYIQMHRLAYNRRIFERIEYKQTEKVSYSDSQWAIIPITTCDTFRCIDLIVYKYVMGRDGQTMGQEQIVKNIGNFFTVLGDTLKVYQNFNGAYTKKEYFKNLLIHQHQYIYFNALKCLNAGTMEMLKRHDENLRKVSIEIYEHLANVDYEIGVKYKVFKHIRDKHYPSDFSIPLIVRFYLSLRVRLKRLIGK